MMWYTDPFVAIPIVSGAIALLSFGGIVFSLMKKKTVVAIFSTIICVICTTAAVDTLVIGYLLRNSV